MDALLNAASVRAACRDQTPLLYRSRTAGARKYWKEVVVLQFHEVGRRLFMEVRSPRDGTKQRFRACWHHAEFKYADCDVHDTPKEARPGTAVHLVGIADLDDATLLQWFDAVNTECQRRHIDPVKRVRYVTEVREIPL